jgi:hypothetical protein
MPFDESKLTTKAREWLDEYFDRPTRPGFQPLEPSQELASDLARQTKIASGLAEAGQNDDEVEKNLRERVERYLVTRRQQPGFHPGEAEYQHEVITQAVAAVANARRRAVRLVDAEDEAAKAAAETDKKSRLRDAMRRMTGA